jgi:putative transposase
LARPLRIEFAGALYHLTARGNARQDIFEDDDDRQMFLESLARVCGRHRWLCHAYCLMSNHYHLLVETGSPTLSKSMKYLNGVYTQYYNRKHARVGHLFQGRFKGILVEKDAYLFELSRYVVLNPVRARMVRLAKHWPWSSYRATAGLALSPECLTTDWILGGFAELWQTDYRYNCRTARRGGGFPLAARRSGRQRATLRSDDLAELEMKVLTPEF